MRLYFMKIQNFHEIAKLVHTNLNDHNFLSYR